MNPYQPPQCSEPVAETGEQAVMQVGYGLAYLLFLLASGLLFVIVGILFYPLTRLATGLFVVSGIAHLALGVLVRRRAYFEVFENRIEFLSPAFPAWRRAKPLESIGARSLHGWVAKRDDFARFVAWREGR
ncbi:hypothetical protein OKA05_09945 [Luteolibacter arcticus]|uniref:Uncharacterized protein n=1 Tax=Luteolibacter arcticus TaxID=1581411 RepID=A0ABT3GGY0_9BACT|nr:hypothetical protein [Luteolibacter arcticus]MCW1922872.1 hypothetical protein [Luteolibacter arcticus]